MEIKLGTKIMVVLHRIVLGLAGLFILEPIDIKGASMYSLESTINADLTF